MGRVYQMKFKRNARLLLMMLLATVMLLSACSSNSGNGKSTNSPTTKPAEGVSEATATPEESELSKHLELSVALWNIEDAFKDPNAANDEIYNKEIAEKFNVTLKPVQITWNDWAEK